MPLVIVILQLLTLPVLVVVLLPLVVVLFIVRISVIFAGVRSRAMSRLSRRTPSRWVLLSGHLAVFLAYGGLLLVIAEGQHSPVVTITSVIGGASVAMSITHWLSSLFAPPLSRADFEQAMTDQTKVIKEGNAQVVAALSEMTQEMSELSGDIRAVLESCTGNEASAGHATDAQD